MTEILKSFDYRSQFVVFATKVEGLLLWIVVSHVMGLSESSSKRIISPNTEIGESGRPWRVKPLLYPLIIMLEVVPEVSGPKW
jgi:hypothetical protein